jgi:hypothetical protein
MLDVYFIIIVIILALLRIYITCSIDDINKKLSSIESTINENNDDQMVIDRVNKEIEKGIRNADGSLKLLPSNDSRLNDYWISVDNIEVSEGYVYIYSNGLRYDTEFIPKFADPIDSYKLHIWIDVGAEDQMPGCIDLVAYDIVKCI